MHTGNTRRRERGTQGIVEAIMTEMSPSPKFTSHTKPRIQEAQRTRGRINAPTSTPRHIIFKRQTIKIKKLMHPLLWLETSTPPYQKRTDPAGRKLVRTHGTAQHQEANSEREQQKKQSRPCSATILRSQDLRIVQGQGAPPRRQGVLPEQVPFCSLAYWGFLSPSSLLWDTPFSIILLGCV